MLGVLSLERDPLRLSDLPGGLTRWVQVVGSIAGVCLFFWLIGQLGKTRKRSTEQSLGTSRPWAARLFKLLLVVGVLGYLALFGLRAPDIPGALSGEGDH